jgi:ABC-2 type transport system permease protein
MSELMSVLRREFLERVRSKAFLLGTLLFPVFMAAMWIIPARMGGGGGTRHIVVVDQAPAGVGQAVVQLLTAPPPAAATDDDDERITFTVDRVAQPLEQVKA